MPLSNMFHKIDTQEMNPSMAEGRKTKKYNQRKIKIKISRKRVVLFLGGNISTPTPIANETVWLRRIKCHLPDSKRPLRNQVEGKILFVNKQGIRSGKIAVNFPRPRSSKSPRASTTQSHASVAWCLRHFHRDWRKWNRATHSAPDRTGNCSKHFVGKNESLK